MEVQGKHKVGTHRAKVHIMYLKVNHCNIMHRIPCWWKRPSILCVVSQVILEQKCGDRKMKSFYSQFWHVKALIFQRTNQKPLKDKLQLQENLVYISQKLHPKCTEYYILMLRSGTFVGTCW